MSGLNYMKLGSTLNNICNTTQLDDTTKCHYAFKNFWGEPFCQSIDPVLWCLFIRLPSNLPDMTGRRTVFQEVDRSIKQIKFHLKS